MLSRIVQPELLDALPCDHPDARHSRRDLRRINLLMGNPRWVGRAVRGLGERVRPHARWLVACEPVRRRHAQREFRRCSRWLGANRVTRHDGGVSIAAGFLGDELPQLLGLPADGWTWHCTATLRGAHPMVARRRGPR